MKSGEGGGDEFSFRFIIFLLHGLKMCFSVMSDYYFDGQGFENPSAPPSAPPSLNSSSVEAPSAVHRNFRMSSKTVAHHTLCISYRDSDCDPDLCCEECMVWPEEVITLYASYRKSLQPKTHSQSSAPPPPPATSVSSPQRSPLADIVRGLFL